MKLSRIFWFLRQIREPEDELYLAFFKLATLSKRDITKMEAALFDRRTKKVK